MRRPSLLQLHDIRRSADRLRRVLRRPPRSGGSDGRVHVRSPFLLPLPASATASWINGQVLRRTVRRASRGLGWRRPPLLWVYTPTVSAHLQRIPHRGIVYHCVDRWWAFSEYDTAIMRAHHERMCRIADVVFASSAALLADCRALTERAFLIPHGVDWEHFSAAAVHPPPPSSACCTSGSTSGSSGLWRSGFPQPPSSSSDP
jgi:hypothetical protein